jgi:uncharacterized membrane protein
MGVSKLFTAEQKKAMTDAIAQAELNTSGEIRIHIESECKIEVLDRAAEVFATLNMHKTALRNGVLFYVSLTDHKFAVLGDAGINAKVTPNFWDEVKNLAITQFKNNNITQGLVDGILLAGEQLKQHFPYNANTDINELSDEINFGK